MGYQFLRERLPGVKTFQFFDQVRFAFPMRGVRQAAIVYRTNGFALRVRVIADALGTLPGIDFE